MCLDLSFFTLAVFILFFIFIMFLTHSDENFYETCNFQFEPFDAAVYV